MPPKSIYLPEKTIARINDELNEDQSFSEWVQMAIERELEGDFDELETLTERVDELEAWKAEVMDDIVTWFRSDTAPAE